MSLDNSTLPYFHEVELNTLALNFLEGILSASTTGEIMVQISLASLSFGILTILVVTSIYFLISRGSAAQTNGRVLLFGTVLLYLSTTTYMAALIWSWSNRNSSISKAFAGLHSQSYNGVDANAAAHAINQQSWMLTIAFGLNFVIGDAIVWWRACVIWQHKVVTCMGPLLILVAIILSFSTNVLATSLIAYKAWEHRKLLKQHFAEGRTTSRVLKALALLTESGCIYCAILTVFLVYEADPTALSGPNYIFETVSNNFEYGCLVPLVAIYPTTIIAIVALKQSPIDTGGFSQPRQARRHGSEATVEGTASTVLFHHSTGVHSSAAATIVETQGATAGTPAPASSTCRCMHSLETSTDQEKEGREADNLV